METFMQQYKQAVSDIKGAILQSQSSGCEIGDGGTTVTVFWHWWVYLLSYTTREMGYFGY